MRFQITDKHYKYIFVILLIPILFIGFYNGVIIEGSSQDVQYFPSKLLLKNIDYYNSYLNGDPWFLSQVPNYYFQLHFLLSPLTILTWIQFKIFWYVLNITLILIIFFDLNKRFSVSFKKLTLYLLPFFFGFPMTNTLGNGQFGIIVISLIYFSWIYKEKYFSLSFILFLLLSKYSFGLPVLFGYFLMGYYRSVFTSILLTLIFPLLYSIIFDLNFLSSIFLPLKVASIVTNIGPSDIMSFTRSIISNPNIQLLTIIFYNLLFVLIFVYYKIQKKILKIQILLCSIVFSFIGFFHLGYDWVVLILILFFLNDGVLKNIFYGLIFINFSLPRFLKIIDNDIVFEIFKSPLYIFINLTLLSILFFKILNESYPKKTLLN